MASQGDPPNFSTSTPSSTSTLSDRQPCWECARRRLSCDSSRPACEKCRSSGIVCPGYANAKPLRWLAPGRVTSRVRRKGKQSPKPSPPPPPPPPPEDEESQSPGPASPIVTEKTDSSDSAGWSDVTSSPDVAQLSEDALSGDEKAVVPVISPTRGINIMVPRVGLVSETSEIVQATYYYNTHVYPEYAAHQLAPSRFVVVVPLEVVCLTPPSISHILVSVALRHRMYRVASNSSSRDNILELRSKYHHHRGLAIKFLNEQIRKSSLQNAYVLMVGVMTFVFAELQQSSSPAWKYHMDAIISMVARSGGMQSICRNQYWMQATIALFIMIYVTGSTTSPPSTFAVEPSTLEDILETTAELWEDMAYPTFLCPSEAFLVIIRINYLRSKLLTVPLSEAGTTPEELLSELKAFSPEAWAASKSSSHDEWLLIARAHHSAAFLYCASVLEAHFEPSSLQDLEILRAVHATRLLSLLKEGESTPAVRRGCLWPLLVAGVEVARDNLSAQSFVGKTFVSLAEDLATPLMLEAKKVLEKFWASGKEKWEDCFDRAYAFVL